MSPKQQFENKLKEFVTTLQGHISGKDGQWTVKGFIDVFKNIVNGSGMFSRLGEKWFDEYWMNYKKITIPDSEGGSKKINTLKEFVEYKKGDVSLIVQRSNSESEE